VTYLTPRELRQSFRETYDRIREFWRREIPKQKPETEKSRNRNGDADSTIYRAGLEAGRIGPVPHLPFVLTAARSHSTCA
jgi:hypothetical protein